LSCIAVLEISVFNDLSAFIVSGDEYANQSYAYVSFTPVIMTNF